MELKLVRNSSLVFQCQAGLLPKEREGTSVIMFLFPSMWRGVSGDTFLYLSLSDSIRIRPAPTAAFDFILPIRTTVASLSL